MIVAGLEVGHWVASRIGCFFDPVCMAAIGWQAGDGKITAGVTFRDWNGVSVEGQIAADRPLVGGFVHAMFDYPFRQLGARKIIVTAPEDNARSVHLLRRLGFTQEARLRDAAPGGDLIICSLRREDCRYLGDHHGKESVRPARA